MMPFSEAVPFAPGAIVRIERVERDARLPPPARFPHFHAAAEIVWIDAGSGRFLCEAAQFGFGPGALIHVPAMAVHDFAFCQGAGAWWVIQFAPDAVAHGALPRAPRCVIPGERARQRIGMLIEWLAQSIGDQAPIDDVQAVLTTLVVAIAQESGPAAPPAATRLPSLARFRPVLDRLDADPGQTLRLAQAASLCAMSPAYFSRTFARVFGEPFTAYQLRLRLFRAARLLASGDAPVSQIAYRLGFRSHAYFSQCFKAHFGVPPSAQRAGQRRRRHD